ncbi:MAG: S8 family serine peptidase, partial [Ardenticatenaceae bacterium]
MKFRHVSLILFLIALMLLLPSLAFGNRAPADTPDSYFVRVPAAAMEQVDALGLAPLVSTDYGSFRWLELDAADFATLSRSGVSFTEHHEAGTISVLGHRFDPVAQGEPALPQALRSDGAGDGFRLVQLSGPTRDEWLGQMTAAGVRVLQYYPHNAYLVWGGPSQAEAVAQLDFVRWQGVFHPGYKVTTDLAKRSGLIVNVDVMFYNDGDVAGTLEAINALGGTIVQHFPSQPDQAFFNAIAQMPAEVVMNVARLEQVLWMGYQSPEPLLDDEMSSQIVAGNYDESFVPFTGYYAWLGDIGYDGSGVTWAIVDTGVDYDHPDLGSHIVGGYDFPGACTEPGEPGTDCPDAGGHGTHVAGIVGGDATAGHTDPDGFLYGLGVAPGYSIFAMNSLSAPSWPPAGGWQEHSKRAVLGGAIGGNNSWTSGEFPTPHGYQATERTHDIMVLDGNFDTTDVAEPFIEVFSAGNSGPAPMTLTSPKEAKNLTVVASTQNYRIGSINQVSSFSSRGPAVDGRWVPTVAAPGEEIASTRNLTGGPACTTPIPGTDNMYAFCSGTSMAAPHVSGGITLVTEWWRSFNGGADPSPDMAKALLVNGAVDMPESGTQQYIPNIHEGWGRIQLD